MADDFSADINTTGTAVVSGATVNGNIEAAGDHDWFKVWLFAGHTYIIRDYGTNLNASLTLGDPTVAITNSAGVQLAFNDDGGSGVSSALRFVAPTSGYYFVDAGEFGNDGTGTYQVRVEAGADTLAAGNVWVTGTTSSDRLGDFNGDGRDDLLQISGGNIYVATSAANGSGFNAYQPLGTGATAADQIGDFNQDGRADFLQFFGGRAYVNLSNGTNYTGYTQWLGSGVQANATHIRANADQADDLFQVTNTGAVQVALSNTANSFNAFVTSNIGATASDQISNGHNYAGFPDVGRSDFNGDGFADILQNFAGRTYVSLSQTNGSFGAFTQWSASGGTNTDTFGDFNGDGRADLYQYANGNAYVALSNGTSFGAWQLFTTGAAASDRIVDMNGDNRADLYQVFEGRAYVALANGNGTASNQVVGSNGYDVWRSGNISTNDLHGDVNGDGLDDVVHVDNAAATVYQSIAFPGVDQHLIIL